MTRRTVPETSGSPSERFPGKSGHLSTLSRETENISGKLAEPLSLRRLNGAGQTLDGLALEDRSQGEQRMTHEPDCLVDAATVARYLGCGRDWVYSHADQLGARRLGAGAKPRLRFDFADVDAALRDGRDEAGSSPVDRWSQ